MVKTISVALLGNPNTGKSSVFNTLTGLKQTVGNYPGVTVEKKIGSFAIDRTTSVQLIDLPGTYGLNTQSIDQSIVFELLLNKNNKDFPDVVIVVADIENLKRNLLLFSQIKDLEIPTILAINMSDQLTSKGIEINVEKFGLGAPVRDYSSESKKHYHEFVDSCLGKGVCSAPFSYSSKLTETILLGVIAGRFPGKTLNWNKNKSQFSENEANEFIGGNYRSF